MAGPVPFVRGLYQPDLRVADLLVRSGQDAADAERRRGEIAAMMWGGLGQTIAGIPQQIQQARRSQTIDESNRLQVDAQRRQMEESDAKRAADASNQQQLTSALPKGRVAALKSLESNPDLYAKAETHFNAIDDNYKRLMGSVAAGVREFGDSPQSVITALDDLEEQGFDAKRLMPLRMRAVEQPEAITQLVDNLLKQSPDEAHRALVSKAPKVAEPFTLSPGQQRFGSDNQPVASVPLSEPKPERPQSPTEASLALAAANGDSAALAAINLLRKQGGESEPLVAIMRDGHPILVPRSQAVNQTPATTREQGRQVTSGDANKIADFNTSLDDVKRLGAAIAASGETGTGAQIGAALPNWVTNLTGWGTDAKKKQSLIDRVKQVIGKTLEGGVLRKEDELKYEKILPTIGDPNEVVKAKLEGLGQAIAQNKQRHMESLKDAGYDTTAFDKRGAEEKWERGPDGKLRKAGG